LKNNIGIGKLRRQEEELRRSSQQGFSSQADDEDDETCHSPNAASPKASSSKPASASVSSSQSPFSLSSLPSSFTALLLSIVDSPAYANLTSTYLNEVFNPSTPDDPHVKYWSVAGRINATNVSIWHPFWLPKMVLDGWEEEEKARIKAEGTSNKWEDEREWGNDGLVTVQSAKWGEFLGIMEGCDRTCASFSLNI
jgi:triacylglycerol lipase